MSIKKKFDENDRWLDRFTIVINLIAIFDILGLTIGCCSMIFTMQSDSVLLLVAGIAVVGIIAIGIFYICSKAIISMMINVKFVRNKLYEKELTEETEPKKEAVELKEESKVEAVELKEESKTEIVDSN